MLLRAKDVKSAIIAKHEIQPIIHTSNSADRYTTVSTEFSRERLLSLRLLLTMDWMNATAEQVHEFERLLNLH